MGAQFCFLLLFLMTCQLPLLLNQFCLPLEFPRIFATMGNKKCYFCQSCEMVQEGIMENSHLRGKGTPGLRVVIQR